MDLATVIGFVIAWAAVVYSMFHCSEGHLDAYVQPGALFLVFGRPVEISRDADASGIRKVNWDRLVRFANLDRNPVILNEEPNLLG